MRKRTGQYLKCTNCGKEVYRSAADLRKGIKNVYCSQQCCKEYRKTHKEANPRFDERNVTKCAYCGKEISVSKDKQNRNDNNFCSMNCFSLYRKSNWVGENSPRYQGKLQRKTCELCGTPFETYFKTQKYCSVICGNKAKENKVQLICTYCQKQYSVPKSAHYWHDERGQTYTFCSKECRNKYFTKEHHPNWIKDRDKLKDRDHSERQDSEIIKWRQEVFARDNYTCKLCGERSREGHKVTLNAHHIKPFSSYKELRTDVNNGITLCEDCHKLTYKKESQFEMLFLDILKHNE